ncbi:hypothetical protein FRC17_003784 [Serendipita sp. 399]|nr:hypothetical protein FRC17_003784 [Serendipita sp. 399]
MGKTGKHSHNRIEAQNNGRGVYNHSASRNSAYEIGKRGTAGRPAPSWIPNLLRQTGAYDPRPNLRSRIFISGLPKDITDQDLEDFASTIGPVHEAYVIYQYTGEALYKETDSGVKRYYAAETAQNMCRVESKGCGMIHFQVVCIIFMISVLNPLFVAQKAKDSMAAWEMYHGKVLNSDDGALRVQIVIDADETWVIPRGDTEKEQLIEIDENHRRQLETGTNNHRKSGGTTLTPQSLSDKQSTTRDLASRISPAIPNTSMQLLLGNHPITAPRSREYNTRTEITPGRTVRGSLSQRRKKGPARLTKSDSVYRSRGPSGSITIGGGDFQARVLLHQGALTAKELDNEMDEYRKGGLMGSDRLHKSHEYNPRFL